MSLEGKSEEQIKGLAAFADRMLAGPKRMETLRLAKEADPNFKHVELDIADQVSAARSDADKRADSLEKELQSERIERARAEKARELKEKGFDIVAVEKVMTDNGISNYETAMKYMKGEAALAPATPLSRTPMALPDDMKEIAKNPAKWANNKAHEVVNEIIANRKTQA